MGLRIGLVALAWLTLAAPAWAENGVFSNWAVVIVAGDWHAHSGAPSEVFDNARRDLASAFAAAGFSPAHIRQFSVHEAGARTGALKSEPAVIHDQFADVANAASDGCLVYFTSHGSPDGILVGDQAWAPGIMAELLDETCGKRPTVAVMSACFSGVFVPALAGDNRMVLTAARSDRASFGCGEEERYTFFDTCVLGELPAAHDFVALGKAVQACVAKREKATDSTPPSEPQMDIGVGLRPILPLYAFAHPHPAALSPAPAAP